MTYELLLFILFIAAELFEMLWQKSSTLLGMIEKIYGYYRKSPYLLYLMHPSYVFGIYLFYISGYNIWILSILVIKSIDIIFKVLLIHKHYILDELSPDMKLLLLQPIHPLMLMVGLILYPFLLYMAIF